MVSQLSSESQKKLLSVSTMKHHHAKSIIWERGSLQRQLLFIESGVVRSQILTGTTTQFGCTEWGPGHWLGDAFLLLDGDTVFRVDAVQDSVVRLVEREDFDALMKTDIQLACDIAKLIASRYRRMLRWVEEALSLPPAERIARKLIRHAKPRFPTGTVFWGTQDNLANCLMLSRPTISKILRGWKRSGLIELSYGSIVIHDGEKLMAAACGAASEEAVER